MTTLLVLARTLHIGSALLLVSLLFFQQFILRGGEDTAAQAGGRIALMRRLDEWMAVTFALHLLSGAGWFWLVTAAMNDSSLAGALNGNLLGTVLLQTQFGHLWAGRLALALALGIVLVFKKRISASARSDWSAFVLASLLLVSLAWAGHAAAGTSYRMLHIGVDVAHLAVASVWPVGLIPLALFLYSSPPSNQEAIAILHRFSRVSLACVILLFLSGLANALFLIPSLAALFTTPYGQLLLGKVVLFFAMAGIGAINRFSFLPALARYPSASIHLRRAVLIESALCLIVLLIVGAMGATPPPPL